MTLLLRAAAPALLAAALSAAGPSDSSRQLTFEQRVAAQGAIERVYYSHQVGATRTFEQAVIREVLEAKVRTYLKQSVALDKFWRTPVTAEALRRELERIEAGSKYPDRLMEVYSALGHDAVLIQETFVRASLVERLAHNFFAYDERIHGDARGKAHGLRRLLQGGELHLLAEHPSRTEVKLAPREQMRLPREAGFSTEARTQGGPEVQEIGTQEFEDLKARDVGEVGPVEEAREAYVIRATLGEGSDGVRAATYTVDKRKWEDWWSQVRAALEDSVRTVALGAGLGRAINVRGQGASGSTAESGGAQANACVPDDTWHNGSLAEVPDRRSGHRAVWTGSVMVVWGGGTGGLQYDPLTDTWEPVATDLIHGDAVWTGQEIIVWDGAGGRGIRYSPVTRTASAISTIGAPRSCGGSIWTGREMIVLCGSPGRVGGRYDPITDTWTSVSTAGAPALRSGDGVWTGTEVILWGMNPSGTSEGGRYNPATDSWSAISTRDAPVFHGPYSREVRAVWTGHVMVAWETMDVVALRDDEDWNPAGGGGRYDPATDRWLPLPDNRVAKSGGKAVWTGREILVWGGTVDDDGPHGEGARYDTLANVWRSISGGPGRRDGYSLVWTGTQMIVWGGRDDGVVLNSGGRYDPAADAWTPTSVASNGQSPISGHAAFWTGNEMLVCCRGGRYDPLTDTWRSMSRIGSPEAGWESQAGEAPAFWTGEQMLVWVGDGGARYDPIRDEWRPMSSVGAPVAFGTGVWTGDEMIVWGLNPSQGGRYDPETDAWSPMSADHAPVVPRHTLRLGAIWTGREMILWGGAGGGTIPGPTRGGLSQPLGRRCTGLTPLSGPARPCSPGQAVLAKGPEGDPTIRPLIPGHQSPPRTRPAARTVGPPSGQAGRWSSGATVVRGDTNP